MPKNTKGGKNFKRGKKNRAPRSLILKDQNTAYAKVLSNLGNGLCNLQIISDKGDEDQCLGHIRGKVVRLKFNKGDIVLVGFRQLTKAIDDDKRLEVDINHKYWPDQVQELVRNGEIKKQEDYNGFEYGDDIEFSYDLDSDEEEDEDADSDEKAKDALKSYAQFNYSDPMAGYAPPSDDEYEEDEVEYDKMGNTIVKPKEVVSQTVASTVDATKSDSEEEVVAKGKHNYKLNKSEEKKLAGITNNAQRSKMQKQMNRDKKSQITAQYMETDEGPVNFDDI